MWEKRGKGESRGRGRGTRKVGEEERIEEGKLAREDGEEREKD